MNLKYLIFVIHFKFQIIKFQIFIDFVEIYLSGGIL